MRGTMSPLLYERIGQMVLMLVIQQPCRFLDAGAVLNQFKCPVLPLVRHPLLGTFAHFLDEMPLQRPQGDAAVLGQRGGTPSGRPRPFRPVLDLLEFIMAHGFLLRF